MAPLPNLQAQPAQPAAATPAGPVAQATNTAQADQVLETISFDNLPLPEAIQQLVHLAGLTWQFDPAILNPKAADGTPIPLPTVKERWRNVSPSQALDALLDNYGWRMKRSSRNPNFFITTGLPGVVDLRVRKVNLLDMPPEAGAMAAQDDTGSSTITFDNLPATDAIRQLAALAGLNIQLDPQLLNPQDANHHPIPAPAAVPTPIQIQTPLGPGWVVKPHASTTAIPAPTVNDTYTNITARQALQRLLDQYGWQTTQIPGNPILRIVSQAPKSPDATTKPTPPK